MRSVGFCVFVLCACAGLAGAWSLESANGVSDEKGLPGELRDEDLLWSMKSGTHQYSVPIFEGGRIYLGLNDQMLKHAVLKKSGGGGAVYIADFSGNLHCFDAATGKRYWVHDPGVDSMPITVTADKGVLYVPTQRGLYAYKAK